MKKSVFNRYVLVLMLVMVPLFSFSQSRPIHEIHSMMLYNFTKYIQWPNYDASQDFVVGVIGSDDVFNTLNDWYGGKERGNKKFVIKKFNSPAEVQKCHIIYIGKKTSRQFDEIKSKTGSTGTLIITDRPGLGKEGSGINFVTDGSKLTIELNESALEKATLKVSSQLTAIAKVI